SDLKSYVNQNRNHAFTLLQSVATSIGQGPMVEMPRGPLLVFLTNIIGMCNITPFQGGDQNKLETLESVNAKLTAFHSFIQESRITCRPCGQCSDKNNAPTGRRGRREERREDKNQDVGNMDLGRTENTITAGIVHQDQGVSNEQNCNPEIHLDPQRRDTRNGCEGPKEHSNRKGDIAKIEKVNTHTDSRVDKPSSQKLSLDLSTTTGPQECRGQVGPGISVKQLDSQVTTNLHEGEGPSDVVRHKTQNDIVGMVNLHTTKEATQAPQNAVEARLSTSHGEAHTQADMSNDEIVTAGMLGVLKQSGEEAALVDPLTQAEDFEQESSHALPQAMEDVDSNVAEDCNQNDYGTERQGSQGDDEFSTDDIDADKESLSQQIVMERDDLNQQRCIPPEDLASLYASDCTYCDDESDGTEESDDVEPTPDTTMTDTCDVWREGLAKPGPPEDLRNTEKIEPAKPLLAPAGTTRRPERSREVCVKILNAEIASEVKKLTVMELKQCLDREVKNKKANIDHCKVLPSGEIRIWTTDDRGAQRLRQVDSWMPGAFGGLQIQRKNSNIKKLRVGQQIVKCSEFTSCAHLRSFLSGQSGAMEQDTIPSNVAGLDRSVDQGRFAYRPLNQGRREIRLVQLGSELQAANDGKRVPLLRMHHTFFDEEEMPQYIALSYTWGTGPKGMVLVEDEGRAARGVLVSTNLLDALCYFATLVDQNLDSVRRIFWIDQLCINQNDKHEKSHQVRMMTDIFGRATMTNVWLGSRGATLSHEEMRKFCQEYDHIRKGIIKVDMKTSELVSGDSIVSQRIDRIHSELSTSQLLQATGSLRMTVQQSRHPPRTKPLIDLIRDMLMHGQTKATQPEDLVYSLMGIASDGATCGIKVDYDKHYSEVFREVALLDLKASGAQALTWSCQPGRNRHPDSCCLPSWVPDPGLRTRLNLLRFSEADPDQPKVYSAAGNRLFEYNVNGKSEILSLRTSYTDRVIEVSKPFKDSVRNHGPVANISQQHQAWLKDFGRFLDAAADRYPTRYDYSTRQDMYWRLPITDRCYDEHVLRRAGPEVKIWYMAILRPDDASSASAVSNSRWYSRSLSIADRAAFITETGYIGLGDQKTVIGDELHLIQGSDTPFILRKSDGHYALVGETYVHGIMDGELVDENTEFEWLQIH
ncbi:MAG: hypothetical protein Q9226_007158, partial [Calogaya cf. arnoldii]